VEGADCVHGDRLYSSIIFERIKPIVTGHHWYHRSLYYGFWIPFFRIGIGSFYGAAYASMCIVLR